MASPSSNTISAEPEKLYRLAARGLDIDRELQATAVRMESILQRFEATCREPEFRLRNAIHLVDDLRTYVREAEALDHWVYQVAQGFEYINQREQTTVHPLPPQSIPITPTSPQLSSTPEAPHRSSPTHSQLDPVTAATTPLETPVVMSISPSSWTPGQVLRQTAPEGDAQVLTTIRYDQGQQFEIGQVSGRAITTVGEHIREYGCLLTSYAMVLQDKGANVAVTDLYKTTYHLKTGRNFDADAASGGIMLSDLNAPYNLVNQATHGQYQSESSILAGDPSQRLAQLLAQIGGSLLLKTELGGGEHWIVVDSQNADGTFNIRDPIRGARSGVRIGSDGAAQYPASPDNEFSYIVKTA
jgi:hypothetical protein